MAVCMARGRHRGTASYRRWRQRYTLEPHGVERLTLELRGVDQLSLEPHGVERLTLEPHGVEQLVWMCFNVSLMIVCLTVPLNVYQLLKDAGAIVPATIDDIELDELIETVGRSARSRAGPAGRDGRLAGGVLLLQSQDRRLLGVVVEVPPRTALRLSRPRRRRRRRQVTRALVVVIIVGV